MTIPKDYSKTIAYYSKAIPKVYSNVAKRIPKIIPVLL